MNKDFRWEFDMKKYTNLWKWMSYLNNNQLVERKVHQHLKHKG